MDDVGITRYTKSSTDEREIVHENMISEHENTPLQQVAAPPHRPDRPHRPLNENNHDTIYRLGRSDQFACQKCKMRGDVHEMRVHECNGKNKKKRS